MAISKKSVDQMTDLKASRVVPVGRLETFAEKLTRLERSKAPEDVIELARARAGGPRWK